MDLIECAMKREREAKVWYEQLAENVTTPDMKELFLILAASEDEHCRALAGLRSGNGEASADFESFDDAVCSFKPLLAKQNGVDVLKGDPDGFRHVITEKEDSIRLFEDLASRGGDEGIRNLLGSLVAEKKRYLSMVENIYAFVESPRTYLAWGEFSNLQEY